MWIDQYLTDEQDPKTAEKVLNKLRDMLTTDEAIVYLAIQKKPAVTIMPDCIVVTSKRLVFCLPGNLGLTTNFVTFNWADIKEVSFREEFFGAKFLAIPLKGENIAIDYIPKVQARKLYQFCNEQLEKQKERQERKLAERQDTQLPTETAVAEVAAHEPAAPVEDEITQKLKKLKVLFERQLITQEEYEQKKLEILSQL